jgi:DNA-binding NarL/FixJ family response regulator
MAGSDINRSTDKVRIVLVDDHPIVREGLIMMMSRRDDLSVCGEAGSAEDALQVVAELHPDLAIVDIFLDGINGIELTKQLHSRYPELPVIVLSMHDEQLYAERARRAGALGYVMKQEASRTIMDAIDAVMGGRLYFGGDIILESSDAGNDNLSVSAAAVDSLSERERNIFRLIGEGLARNQIAEKLDISTKTVETHRSNIKYKLDIGSAADLKECAALWLSKSG